MVIAGGMAVGDIFSSHIIRKKKTQNVSREQKETVTSHVWNDFWYFFLFLFFIYFLFVVDFVIH